MRYRQRCDIYTPVRTTTTTTRRHLLRTTFHPRARLAQTALLLPSGDQRFLHNPSMETDSGQRAMLRRREGARGRRERPL